MIHEIGTLEINETLERLCVIGVLKPEHQHLEAKGLRKLHKIHSEFLVKWIRFIIN